MSDERITVGERVDDGTSVELPVVQVLTGRGFVTGKSGSGKSNTASVVIEELLDAGYPVLIVDTDGEYYGLKEAYELLHAGADEECDIQVRPEHAEKLATLALEENVPIILDVSGYLDEDDADELLRETARHLFTKEKKLKKPFLLVVEEVHEYLPQKGGGGETGKMLIKIGKRGRKHGLGILGISQRPADVKKDFITQANWLVWHRLTWDNDTKVVGRVVDSAYEEAVSELGDGEAFVQTDWTEADVRRVQFRRKRTFDAGATPGLDDFERPELKSVSDSLMDDLADISQAEERRESELADLRQALDRKEVEIDQLEAELERARDVSNAARQLANAFSRGDVTASPEEVSERIAERDRRIEELESELSSREERIEALESGLADARAEIERLREARDELQAERDALAADLEVARTVDAADAGGDPTAAPSGDADVGSGDVDVGSGDAEVVSGAASDGREESDADSGMALGKASAEPDDDGIIVAESEPSAENDSDPAEPRADDSEDAGEEPAPEIDRRALKILLQEGPVEDRIDAAIRESLVNADDGWTIVHLIAREGPVAPSTLADRIDQEPDATRTLFAELRAYEFTRRDRRGRHWFDAEAMAAVLDRDPPGEQFQEFQDHAEHVE